MQKEISGLDPVKHAELRISSGGVLEVKVIERIPAYLLWRWAGSLDETGAYVKNVGSRLIILTFDRRRGGGPSNFAS